MAAAGLDALVVYSGPASYASVRWLTNYQPIGGNTFAVIREDGGITVTTDGVLHGEPMHSMVWTCRAADLRCAAGPIYGGAPEEVATLAAAAVGTARRVASLAGSLAIPQRFYSALAAVLPGLAPADAVVANARMIKSAEIDAMGQSGKIADAAFDAVFAALAPAIADADVAAAAVAAMMRRGAVESFALAWSGPLAGGGLVSLRSHPRGWRDGVPRPRRQLQGLLLRYQPHLHCRPAGAPRCRRPARGIGGSTPRGWRRCAGPHHR